MQITVSDQSVVLSSTSLKLCHMCGYVALKVVGLGKGWANGLWETGQSVFNMGPEWSEVQGYHTSKRFFSF